MIPSNRNDQIPPIIEERNNHANSLVDEMYILAESITKSYEEQGAISDDLHEQCEGLEDRFKAMGELTVLFSGEGFMPYELPDGDEDTVYRHDDLLQGTFSGLVLCDEYAVDYLELDDLEILSEEDPSSLLQDEDIMDEVRAELLTPPSGLRLYAEFLLDSSEEESPVAGSTIRADRILYYALMNVSKLKFNGLGETTIPTSTEETIIDDLHKASRKMWRLLKDTGFRRQSLIKQRLAIDKLLLAMEEQIQIRRFTMLSPESDILIPITKDGTRQLAYVDTSSLDYSFALEPLRIDSLDAFELHNGRAIRNDNQLTGIANSGICIVADMGDAMQELHELETSIVWIPVNFPSNNRKFANNAFDAHIELMD